MKSIRLSLKHAEALERYLQADSIFGSLDLELRLALGSLRYGIAATKSRPKSSAVRKAERKRRTKTAETKEIRAEVFARARWLCEFACGSPATDLHHAFGRKEQQAIGTCLALCRWCHREVTEHTGGAASSWMRVTVAFKRAGLQNSSDRAAVLAEKHRAKAALGAERRSA